MKKLAHGFVLTAILAAAYAQTSDQIRRATIRGSGGSSGKCTIEVRVDGVAEVDIYGDSGRLRTLAGQPATWTRMECNGPLPYNMTDFRFRGIDGRGSQRLVSDPRNNNSMAVVRIEDPRGGSEGYTFDIEWSGASGGAPADGFNTPGYGSDRRGGFGYGGRGRGGLSAEQTIDLCRNEVRARGERDYGLRNIDITSAALDTNQGRRDWVTGSFNERSFGPRRGGEYRFNCQVDSRSGQVQTVEILRNGSLLQPGSGGGQPADQNQGLRACQDAAVARANRDGYQNVRFQSTAADPRRADWITGSLTASRASITDTFDFSCSMDTRNATVRNLEWRRR